MKCIGDKTMTSKTSKTKTKRKPNLKPHSKLQQVQSQANHAMYFRLHEFNTCALSKILVSYHTKQLIDQYNKLVVLLKTSIYVDATFTKNLIRERDAKRNSNKD